MTKFYDSYISDLPFSQTFKDACNANQVILLRELLEIPVAELDRLPWLTNAMLEELAVFERENNIRQYPDKDIS